MRFQRHALLYTIITLKVVALHPDKTFELSELPCNSLNKCKAIGKDSRMIYMSTGSWLII